MFTRSSRALSGFKPNGKRPFLYLDGSSDRILRTCAKSSHGPHQNSSKVPIQWGFTICIHMYVYIYISICYYVTYVTYVQTKPCHKSAKSAIGLMEHRFFQTSQLLVAFSVMQSIMRSLISGSNWFSGS